MKTLCLRSFFFILTLFLSISVSATDPLEEYFYASGKIRVVLGVAIVVLAGIFVYLFSLERRLKKLEKKNKAS
ncbi:MAG: CcmD family protein [Crocinitomicaceae bacterium]|nr:CcmD family protein [Crocinitomicaceae bacterium]